MDLGLPSALCFAYLFGSVNSAVIVCKMMKLPSPLQAGSNNPGATNVLRIAGKKPALYTLLGDAAKGLLPVLIAQYWALSAFSLGLVALVAVLGHVFPIFFEYKGGKGIATTLGCALGLNFSVGLITLAIWAVAAWRTRYSSLAALIATASLPITTAIFIHWSVLFPLSGLAALVFWRHQSNISNLRAGTETKIDFSEKTAPQKK